MKHFSSITKYIGLIDEESYGKWIIDMTNKGTLEDPKQMPFVAYSNTIDIFIEDLYSFCDNHPEYEHTHYNETLKKNGIMWNMRSMKNVDVSNLDSKCIIALLIGAVRAERFCEGALLSFFESGCIHKWLNRLKELDS